MELERSHRPGPSTTSELFICFTSRLSNSTSMRLSNPKSSSIMSPGRTDKPPISLSTSLSRRLRSKNGSLKGGQSPMFPPGVSKKRGCSAFENPEPSSPKVTCIGQVRVKTKKQGKKMKMNMRACRPKRKGSKNGGGGETSLRRIEGLTRQTSQHFQQRRGDGEEGCLQNRNQRWVHFPLTICEALRGFGSEFSCLLPCRSSCFSSSEDKEAAELGKVGLNEENHRHHHHHHHHRQEKENTSTGSSCGGAVFRWLVALHEGEGKTRDIELVVGGEEEEERGGNRVRSERVVERESSRRRSIFDDMDFNFDEICGADKKNEIGGTQGEEKEEAARVSICIPPKNALLLMRCRSDPVKMSALANRFWESPVRKDYGEEECEDEEEEEEEAVEDCNREMGGHRVSVERRSKDYEVEMLEGKEIQGGCCGKVEALADSTEERGDADEKKGTGEGKIEETSDSDIRSQEKVDSEEDENRLIEETNGSIGRSAESNLVSDPDRIAEDEIGELLQSLFDDSNLYDVEERGGPEEAAPSSKAAESREESQQHDPAAEKANPVEAFEKDTIFVQIEGDNGHQRPRLEEDEMEEIREEEAAEEEKKPLAATTQQTQRRCEQNQSQSRPSSSSDDNEEKADSEKPREDVTLMEKEEEEEGEEESAGGLPDCLLLMMYEPKLSMEVSKETWVRTTDFIRWLPERHRQHHLKKVNPTMDRPDEPNKKINEGNSNNKKKNRVLLLPTENDTPPAAAAAAAVAQHGMIQPPRSSCSFPVGVAKQQKTGGVSMGSGVEKKKLVGGYEPLVLTRCKSEPMRSAPAKFAMAAAAAAAAKPDVPAACFWKNRKMEPHRSATCGMGAAAAGVGF